MPGHVGPILDLRSLCKNVCRNKIPGHDCMSICYITLSADGAVTVNNVVRKL